MHILYEKVKEAVEKGGRCHFAKLSGYTNISKCLRKLDQFLETGDAPDFFIFTLCDAVSLPRGEVAVAILHHRKKLQDQAEREEEEYRRRTFRPHVIVSTDGSSKSAIFTKALTAHWLQIVLSDQSNNGRSVPDIIKKHFEEHKGMLVTFGKITCYIHRPAYDVSIVYSTGGEVMKRVNKAMYAPSASLSLKNGREIPIGILSKGGANG